MLYHQIYYLKFNASYNIKRVLHQHSIAQAQFPLKVTGTRVYLEKQ